MATIHDHQHNYGGYQASYGNQGGGYPSADQLHRAPNYLHPAMPVTTHASNGMASLTQGLGALNLQQASFAHNKPSSALSSNASVAPTYGGVPLGNHISGYGASQYLYPGGYMGQNATQAHHTMAQNPAGYSPVTTQFMPQTSYQGFPQHMSNGHSPLSQNWSSRVPSGDVPSLVTPRRDSISSNEQDQPGTPYAGTSTYGGGVAVVDRTPPELYNQHTPSPTQLSNLYVPPNSAKTQFASTPPTDILDMLMKDPIIPRAIPAPSSPLKPLDRALQNPGGETNVYIRGLQPETTDEMLHEYGSRFGDIKSSKSIIDHNTGLCKGFGFIKYHNYEDAGRCIRGFHHLGYEVSFARESFYAKLKKFADEHNTNLYVSNLPRSMNEHELGSLFAPHTVCSTRVLREANGNGRGVGFARFETRDVCEIIIRDFNNSVVVQPKSEEEHIIQIRYADTAEQKWLKQQTAAARQFRTAEYEFATAHRRPYIQGQNRTDSTSASNTSSNELENYLAASNGAAPRYIPPAFRHQAPVRQPLSTIPSQQVLHTVRPNTNPEPGLASANGQADAEGKPGQTEPAIAHSGSEAKNEDASESNT
ncbi:MAG: hypothetical protein M1820_001215 [Bogoriella megaspora]|nr:MAG: hypothetical protein M1820_001215 [Bogoriella megaspora]